MTLNEHTLKKWYWWHKWTSLICTLFLLILCLTGLPLIFNNELKNFLQPLKESSKQPDNTPLLSLNEIARVAQDAHPDKVFQYFFQEPGESNTITIGMNEKPESPEEEGQALVIDTRTGEILGQHEGDEGILAFILSLHVELFLGLAGKALLGAMALLFLISMISGAALYSPFMRDRSFAVVRRKSEPRTKWLDLHNGLGITLLAWALVVGGTGMINTWADFALKYWQFTEMASMIKENPPATDEVPDPRKLAPIQQVVDTAIASSPGMKFGFAAFPGNEYSSAHHYVIFLRGTTALTSRLFKPVLIDGTTGDFTASRPMPWYISTILVSQPLHFGDYGGLPLKILWAILDIATIFVLISGLYLWNQKRRLPLEFEASRKATLAEEEHA